MIAAVVLSGLGEKMTIWLKDYLPALYAQPGFKNAFDYVYQEALRGRLLGQGNHVLLVALAAETLSIVAWAARIVWKGRPCSLAASPLPRPR